MNRIEKLPRLRYLLSTTFSLILERTSPSFFHDHDFEFSGEHFYRVSHIEPKKISTIVPSENKSINHDDTFRPIIKFKGVSAVSQGEGNGTRLETVKESFTAAFDESPGKIVHFNCSSSGGTISNLYARSGWKKYIYIYIWPCYRRNNSN